MSYYENYEKDDLLYYMENFLKGHPISELLEIVTDAVERREWDETDA